MQFIDTWCNQNWNTVKSYLAIVLLWKKTRKEIWHPISKLRKYSALIFHFQITFNFWKCFPLCYVFHNIRIRNKRLTVSIWLLHFFSLLHSHLWTIWRFCTMVSLEKNKIKIPGKKKKKDLEFRTLFCIWVLLKDSWFSLSTRSCILYTCIPCVRLLSQSSFSKAGITPALRFLPFSLPQYIHLLIYKQRANEKFSHLQ